MRTARVITGGIFALGCLACGAGDRAGGAAWQAVTDTIGDTIVVRTVSGSVWGAPADLVEEMRIGVFEGEEEYMLGAVNSLAVDEAGSIYLHDRQVPALRKYAPDGTYVATFGREGGGPGEYRQADGGLAALPDGRIVLRDPGNARLQLYSIDGEPLGSWPLRGGFSTSNPLVVDTAGNVYTMVLIDPKADVTEWRMGMARYAPDGTPGDTIAAPTWDYEEAHIIARGEHGTSVNSVPFSPRDTWVFSPLGRMVGGLSTRYAVDEFLPDGTVLRIERNIEPVPIAAGERANAEERAIANMRGMIPGWKWNGPPIPDEKPPFKGIYVGQDGRIWVQRSQPGVEIQVDETSVTTPDGHRPPPLRWREPVVFDVFEPDGHYLGEVHAPDGFSTFPTPIFRGDHVWAIVRDELDVQYVVRFSVRREGSGDVAG